ncbi:MAG: universal stress protein [Rhodothermales bacterium]
MLNIKSILVPTDLSVAARNAFTVARDVARRFDASLHVLHVKPTESQFAAFARWFATPMPETGDAGAKAELSEHYAGYDKLKIVEREGAGVADTILDYARDCDIDLIVMGTHGHRSLDHPALGGAAGDVVRGARSPVMTVRSRREEPKTFEGFDRILVAVDFGENSPALVRAAKHLASLYDASVSLLFVSEEHLVPVFSDTGMMSVTTLKVDDEIAENAGAALRQMDEETGSSDVEVDYLVESGNPAREIVSAAADRAADLIIVGRRGHSPHEGILLGTVTEHVVRTAKSPVLTIGTKE